MAERLDTPLERRVTWRPTLDQEVVGRGAEQFARFMGTGKFLMYMTVFVIVWVAINSIGLLGLHWDPYPFILLNLFFSVQASYAAPLILLAQNRQDDRDRVGLEQDRLQAERNLADTEFLAREMAALRIAVSEVATRDFVRSELRALLEELDTDEPKAKERKDKPRRKKPAPSSDPDAAGAPAEQPAGVPEP